MTTPATSPAPASLPPRWTASWFAPAFTLALALSFTACGGGDAVSPASESTTETTPMETTTPPTDIESDLPVPGSSAVLMVTSAGELRIELYPNEAPRTVENFLQYVEDGFYDGTIFHRVVRGFVIQGGGFTADMMEKETREPIENEARNGLKNLRGTLSMARTMDPHSATSQFFVNTRDNAMLDHTSPDPRGWGYAVFGKVFEGMEAVDRIEASPVVSRGGHNDVPDTPIVIESATVVAR